MKRFYKEVTVIEKDGMFAVCLDGKTIKTPEKSPCLMPTNEMAKAVAKEWDDQETEIDPHNMPLTKLINTAIDRVGKRREDLIDELVGFAGSDQLCYRAEHPDELVILQEKTWGPLLVQLRNNHGIKFKITTGVMFIEQDATELEKFREIIKRIDDYELTAYYAMTTVTGSITIGLNLFENNLTIDEAWNAGHLDENFQVSQWGEDDEAAQRRQNLKNELINTTQFLALSRN